MDVNKKNNDNAFCVGNVTNFSTMKVAIYASPFCRSYVKLQSCFFNGGHVVRQPLKMLCL